ncbi:MAG: symmetrical bis(5'-nucleosyl)-tetraphosphatase [Deltaproteobacteria bacterium]|nr:MAG: symmetrical bis(5'-nucleosyl)-tetraphosphatase [Deltaproteobacteria bacterium]
MATYVIGDLQGCLDTLQRLLDTIAFDPARDHLLFCGDLVNRGPRSLDTLRFVRSLCESGHAETVLGNHDLHLLAAAENLRPAQRRDTLQEILEATDREGLLAWLRTRPLLLRRGDLVLVHAGLLPSWSIEEASALASEAEAVLRARGPAPLMGPFPPRYHANMAAPTRVAMTVAVLTRVRMCSAPDEPDFSFKRPPEEAPDGLQPWFAHPHPSWSGSRIVFGHWAALGHRQLDVGVALDSGCVWGRTLTAWCQEEDRVFQVDAIDARTGTALAPEQPQPRKGRTRG